MRTEKEMLQLIVARAEEDERIRTVLLSGSRANPTIKKDAYQDYDIVYLVNEIESFKNDPTWINFFGSIILMQEPELMELFPVQRDGRLVYLMLFEDDNRIDLTMIPVQKYEAMLGKDSLFHVLLDKDSLFDSIPAANDSDYIVTKPSAKEFADCSNEFWWCITNVAKGLCRNELSYAKKMMEEPVRDMLLLLLSWQVGVQTNFSANTGKYGKFLQIYLSEEMWQTWITTYADGQVESMWKALFTSCYLFQEVSRSVGNSCGYLVEDETKVLQHLERLKEQSRQ